MDKNKITLEGLGSFVDATHVVIAKADGTMKQLKQKKILLQRIEACICPLSKLIKKE
jgi:hypothetical protein